VKVLKTLLLLACSTNAVLAQRPADSRSAPVVNRTVIPSEVVYLTDHGIFPATIERAKGQFLLVVINRTSSPALTLLIKDSHGSAAANANNSLNKNHEFWLDLTPGEYTVTEASNPDIHFTLTVK
jgi:hypothetical protein